MKIYCSKRNSYNLDNYLGKDLWVKAGILDRSSAVGPIGGNLKVYYIRILSEKDDIIKYNRILNSRVDNLRKIWDTSFLDEVYEEDIHNVGLFGENEVYTTEELLDGGAGA